MNDEERAAKAAELRRLLDEQEAKRAELLAELRAMTGDPGHEEINEALRQAAGRGTAPPGSGAESINEQIRRAAGRPASEQED